MFYLLNVKHCSVFLSFMLNVQYTSLVVPNYLYQQITFFPVEASVCWIPFQPCKFLPTVTAELLLISIGSYCVFSSNFILVLII